MPRSILLVPKIRRHRYDLAVVAVRRDHTSGVSVLKVYRPWSDLPKLLMEPTKIGQFFRIQSQRNQSLE